MNYVDPSGLLASAMTAQAPIVIQLLAARLGLAGAGNRRALFARMDALFGDETGLAASDHSSWARPSRQTGDVRLAQMRLRNWKAFERAELTFPAGNDRQSIVIVEGANGFGKSSILEAYAFGLFGARALSEVGFLISGATRASGQRRSYRALIEKSLHRSERAQNEGMSAVTLEFLTEAGPLSIERKWYFDEDGTFIDDDEELLVRAGSDRNPLPVPDGIDAIEWYQAEIERRILPVELAPFFLFDGEQVERWSERRLSDQVHFALTRLLGLGEFNALAQDLRDYSRDRERGIADIDFSQIERLEAAIQLRESALATQRAERDRLDLQLRDSHAERSAILASIADLGSVSHADLQTLLEGRHRLGADKQRVQRELIAAICDEGPLLLAGAKLLAGTNASIRAAAERQALALQPDEIDILWRRIASLEPALSADAADDLKCRLNRACQLPADDPVHEPHRHLDRKARRMVSERLAVAIDQGLGRVRTASSTRSMVDAELANASEALKRQEGNRSRATALQTKLARLGEAIDAGETARRDVQAVIDEQEAELGPFYTELARLRDVANDAEPRLRAAGRARDLAVAIDRHVQEIADPEHQRFADAVTTSFRRLSHKDQIQRIEIFADGEVRLVDRHERDVTDYRLSAGESQLFAMALIGAVSALLGDRLPLVVDTPLGRLDTQHRQSVLDMFGRRASQTILLTQPEELTNDHLDRIRPAVAGIVNLRHEADVLTGVGISTVAASHAVIMR